MSPTFSAHPVSLRTFRAVAAYCLAAVFAISAGVPAPARAAAAEGGHAVQLEKLRSRIKLLRDSLDRDRTKQSALSRQLHSTEVRIADLGARLFRLNKVLADHQAQLAQLRSRQAAAQAALAGLREALARQVRAAYVMGRDEQLKLLLNQRDPATISRMLVYYRYFAQARAARIKSVRVQLQNLARVGQSISEETAQLTRLKGQRSAEREHLQHERADRAAVLARLQTRIETKSQRLAHMLHNERRLQQLVQKLRQTWAGVPPQPGTQRPFRRLKGRLPWPVAGTLLARYGGLRAGSNLRWQGVFIGAPPGEPVRAVAPGRVVFADWLRGFGLLLIIDHGHGYMSLYGHNQVLLTQVGDRVAAGEPVALTGDSGGARQSGVYFELRSQGHTIDPLRWCRGSPAPATVARP